MNRYETEFFDRQGPVGVLPILEGWERINSLKAGMLTTEERWDRFILMTDRSNDNTFPPPPAEAALAVATA